MTFYITCISTLFIGIICFFRGDFNFTTNYSGVISLFLIAIISTILALMSLIKGIKIIGPSIASILNTLEPILSILLGILILKEPITIFIVIGSLLVILSIIIITLDNNCYCEKNQSQALVDLRKEETL